MVERLEASKALLDVQQKKLAARVGEIEGAVFRRHHPLPPLRAAPQGSGKETATAALDASWPEVPVGGQWGGFNQTVWLHGEIEVPADWAGEAVFLLIHLAGEGAVPPMNQLAGPEGLAYLDGAPFSGVDREHTELLLAARARGDERWRLAIEVFSAAVRGAHTLQRYELATRDPAAAELAADLRAAYDTLRVLDPSSADYAVLSRAIDAALALVDFRRPRSDAFYESLGPARLAFRHALAGYRHGSRPTVVATGHAHLDVAWLWPLSQTRRKAARTFSTVLRLMEQYPDFHFTQSQPQLYQYVKEDEPELYEQVKRRVAEGRWEPTGGMWLEPDCNLPRGESLVRQLVYGQRFFEEEFGRRSDLLWLPDAFGYSWALPQLLRGAGVGRFVTSKISWSQFNTFPYDTFRWRGIDGTEVLAHFITTPTPVIPGFTARFFTYNGAMTAEEVSGTVAAYRQKDVNDRLLYLFGWGDGGGGPTRRMLESARRLGELPSMPALEQGGAEATLRRIEENALGGENAARTPVWDGELYLEYHRGTYTGQGRTKYAHRRAELALHEAELWQAAARPRGAGGPWTALDDAWRTLLLQEFHDILPGSSIPEVYADAARDLASVTERARGVADAGMSAIAGAGGDGTAFAVFNATPWAGRDPVEVELPAGADAPPTFVSGDESLTVQPLDSGDGARRVLVAPPHGGVPGLGYASWAVGTATAAAPAPGRAAAAGLHVDERALENDAYRIELDERGRMRSLVDKRVAGGREVIALGELANQLIAFEDKPLMFDAWDIDLFYEEKPYRVDDVESLRVVERGPLRGGVEIRRRFLDSTIVQRLLVYRDLPRIDVQTEVDWHQHQVLLKAAFPVAVRATEATYEIQFGTIRRPTHRNTSWDVARFEVPAQRWADLSEGDYGVALLNDGKYGHDVHGHVVRLTLLKSGIMPDPPADQGTHRFTYSLLPHLGDWRGGDVVAHAAALNLPLRARRAQGDGSTLPLQPGRSFVACDRPGLVVDTVKPAMDGRGLILRFYEAHGTRGPATLRFAHPVERAEACTLLEERRGNVERAGHDSLAVYVRPYEVKTIRVLLAPS